MGLRARVRESGQFIREIKTRKVWDRRNEFLVTRSLYTLMRGQSATESPGDSTTRLTQATAPGISPTRRAGAFLNRNKSRMRGYLAPLSQPHLCEDADSPSCRSIRWSTMCLRLLPCSAAHALRCSYRSRSTSSQGSRPSRSRRFVGGANCEVSVAIFNHYPFYAASNRRVRQMPKVPRQQKTATVHCLGHAREPRLMPSANTAVRRACGTEGWSCVRSTPRSAH